MKYDSEWKEFEDTGKVESYLKYRKAREKNRTDFNEEIGVIEGENSEVIQSKGDSN